MRHMNALFRRNIKGVLRLGECAARDRVPAPRLTHGQGNRICEIVPAVPRVADSHGATALVHDSEEMEVRYPSGFASRWGGAAWPR